MDGAGAPLRAGTRRRWTRGSAGRPRRSRSAGPRHWRSRPPRPASGGT